MVQKMPFTDGLFVVGGGRGATTLSITRFSITTLSITRFSITTLSIMIFSILINKCDTQHYG